MSLENLYVYGVPLVSIGEWAGRNAIGAKKASISASDKNRKTSESSRFLLNTKIGTSDKMYQYPNHNQLLTTNNVAFWQYC